MDRRRCTERRDPSYWDHTNPPHPHHPMFNKSNIYYYCTYCNSPTILYHTILYYTIPYHTIPYYTILHYTTLHYPMFNKSKLGFIKCDNLLNTHNTELVHCNLNSLNGLTSDLWGWGGFVWSP